MTPDFITSNIESALASILNYLYLWLFVHYKALPISRLKDIKLYLYHMNFLYTNCRVEGCVIRFQNIAYVFQK